MTRIVIPLICLPLPLLAEVPRVVTDIPPVQAMAAAVMGELGSPEVIVPAGTSPHFASLRPSQARALEQADLILRIGPNLTPWLDVSIEALGSGATDIILLEAPGTMQLPAREASVFDNHDHHDHGHDDAHDDHADDDHADKHDDHADAHDDHADKHDDHHDGLTDPHAWLDPDNAKTWTTLIAETLSKLDPENASTYAANAQAALAAIDAVDARLKAQLAPVADAPYSVFHDAYQYFEAQYGLAPVGALLSLEAEAASAARLRALNTATKEAGVTCLFREPQLPDDLLFVLGEGLDARIATIDPLGADIAPGPDAYPAILASIGDAMSTCLAPSG